jgi:CubicO group peptidase (beta-lactamase class C family)
MRRFLVPGSLAIFLLVGAPARAQTSEPLLGLFRDYLESLRVQAGIPGLSAALVGRDNIIWDHSFGRQDVERSVPATIDTPYHLDGLTQLLTSALVLRCVEDGLLSLNTPLGQFSPAVPEPQATIGQLLTHTSGAPADPVFTHDLSRLAPLPMAIRRGCAGDSFRETLANQLELIGMGDSVPGSDAVRIAPPAEGIPTASQSERYRLVLNRLATPYVVSPLRRLVRSEYTETTLTPSSGLISTVRDLATFDLALKHGDLLRAPTLASAWSAPVTASGQRLPHGVGWFVQTYNGETIVWQFGVSDAGSSALIMSVPSRGLTLILLANSSGLVRPFALEAGDLRVSPFGRLFLGLLVR